MTVSGPGTNHLLPKHTVNKSHQTDISRQHQLWRSLGGQDILIGGTTDHDADVDALAVIFAEWTSGNSFVDRVSNLSSGLLSAGQVHDDNVRDWMKGGRGKDWYFADTSGPEKHKLFGFDSLEDESTVLPSVSVRR